MVDTGLEIYTLGGVRMLRAGEPLTGLSTRKAEALLIYLASTRRPQPREVLADLFWDERSQSQALGNLRGVLSNIHQTLGETLLISRDQVELNPSSLLWLDAAELEACLESLPRQGGLNPSLASQVAEALKLYRGEFLAGFSVYDCRGFQDWQARQRERLHRLAAEGLSALVEYALQHQEYQVGIGYATRLLELDPLMESANRQMIWLLSSSGQRPAALSQYEIFQKLLRTELGIEPAPETRELYTQIRAGKQVLPSDISQAPSLMRIPSAGEEPPAPGQPPFKGLQYFDVDDAGLFYGRGKVTARLVEAVSQQRFLAVVGASGSGKSSVVRAGLVPALQSSQPAAWEIFILSPAAQPLESLAIHLTRSSESVTACATLLDDLRHDPRSLYLYARRQLADSEKRWLVIVDQFEELFTLCRDAGERQMFIEQLLQAAQTDGSRVHVLIALRADFYDHVAEYADLRQAIASHQEYLGAMSAEELRQAIEEPAKLGDWEFSPGLVDLMLHEVGAEADRQPEPGALPLLSHALLETWNHRRGRLMNLKAYAESGGVHQAIARTAERLYSQELSPQQQEIARNIFLRLTELGEGTQDTRRRAAIQELFPPAPYADPKDVEEVLVKLADARLIITGEGTAEVAHEALIREWPTLREWLTKNREGLLVQRRLMEAAQEWLLLEKDVGILYRGVKLAQASEWAQAYPQQLNAQEQAFLEASQETAQREEQEREAQRQRELEAARKLAETEKGRAEAERQRAEEQGKSAQRLRRRAWLLGGAVVLALILAGAAVVFGQQADSNAKLANQNMVTAQSEAQQRATAEQRALGLQATAESEAQQRATSEAVAVQEEQTAQEQERLATSRFLTSAALNNLKLDAQLSAHLALQALKTFPTYEAENALHLALPELHLLRSIPMTWNPTPYGGWIIHDGRQLIEAAVDGVQLMDTKTGEQSMLAQGKMCSGLFFIPWDERWVGAQCNYGSQPLDLRVFEIETKKLLFTFPDPAPAVLATNGLIPPSSTHPLLAYEGWDDLTFHVWDVMTGKEVLVDRTHMDIANGIPSRDGKRLATIDPKFVTIWDLETNQELIQFDTRTSFGYYGDFNPDGTRLALLAGDYTTIEVWDLTTLTPKPRLENVLRSDVGLNSVLYSPDGTRLAAGGQDRLVRVWDTQTGKLQTILSGHAGFTNVLSFNRDGTRLYSSSNDNTIIEWDMSPNRELLTLSGQIGSSSFSPDGRQLALGGAAGSLSIVDSLTGKTLRSWKAQGDRIEDIAWSPDGQRLATSDGNSRLGIASDQTAKIWEASTGKLLKEIPGDQYQGFPMIAWSPDGSRFVSASWYTGTALIWDSDSWNLIRTTPQQPDGLFAFAYSPDGQKLAIYTWSNLIIWDAMTGSRVFTKSGHTVYGLAFSPNGQRLAVGQADGSILLFKITGAGVEQESAELSCGAWVYTVAFSPDGTLLAAGDVTGKVRVWDLKTMQIRLQMPTFTDPVYRVAFSPDSRRLVASSMAGVTYFYVLPQDELVDLARSRIALQWKIEDCREYLHTETCPAEP